MDYLVAVLWALGAMSDSTDADAAHGARSGATGDDGAPTSTADVLPPSHGDAWRDRPLGPLSGLGGSSDKLRAKKFDPSGSLVGASSAQARADKPRKEAMDWPKVTEQMRMVMLLVAVALAVARAPHVMALKALGVSSVSWLFTFGPVGMTLAVPIGLLCVLLGMTSTWSDDDVSLIEVLDYNLEDGFNQYNAFMWYYLRQKHGIGGVWTKLVASLKGRVLRGDLPYYPPRL